MSLNFAQEHFFIRRLPFGFAKRNQIIIDHQTDQSKIMHTSHTPMAAILETQRACGASATIELITEGLFETLLNQIYQEGDSEEAMQMVEDIGDDLDLTSLAASVPETEDLLEQEGDAPIIKLINAVLAEAIKENASDIHIETFEKRLVIRFRADGVLREVVQPKRALAPLLVSRIKVMAKLDIAEKRVPQDGRISLRLAGREVDVRVSTLPSNHGERVVMRLLDKQAGRLDLTHLGMTPTDLDRINNLISRPHGIILVTGPTGSGKTTTLYGALESLNDHQRNIMTVEDPIEYSLPGIGQTQVNTKVDMTFAAGLRAILRQDPDVVMIGEIRDFETVEIAVQASLTGHLVLSTLHTNSAIGSLTRLQDMGVEPFLLSSSLIGVLAQRLVRTLCASCKEAYIPDEAECKVLEIDSAQPVQIYRACGCKDCKNTGYKGRLGIYEIVQIDDTLRTMIHDGSSEQEMTAQARTATPSILQDGIGKILNGRTSLDEVLRVCRSK
ncbi:type II secretion system ATPase GspE [Marinicellulosiphila megalodicopiae]|uniref:type II secretion system ATPase GspE n=1 Tax=Marinicellulosiphila megalodicopiae TaxID=2724896 RepID=UPI003BAE4885